MKRRKNAEWFDQRIRDIESKASNFLETKRELKPRLETLKIIAIYILMGTLWILLSDKILGYFVEDTDRFMQLQTYKGWFFIMTTGVIFYFIISGKIILFKKATDEIFHGYEELSATHEELLAMEEELNQQFEELEKHRDALMISDQRYELAVEGANDGIWDWDLASDIFFYSLKWKTAFGYTEEELPNTYDSWKQLLHPDDKERVTREAEEYLEGKSGIYENTYRLRCKNGEYRWILSRGKAIWDGEGKAVRVAGSHTDITEFMELQETLHREKELSESILNGASIIILGISPDGTIIQFNPFAEQVTGYKEKDVIGKRWFELFIPEERRRYTKDVVHRILQGEIIRNQENQVMTKDGRRIDVLWNNSALYDSQGNVLGVVATGLDITERKVMENRLHTLAYYDALVGLPNRQMFEITLKHSIKKAEKENSKFALLYIDLDNFKNVNDTLGHPYGDKLLKKIASALKAMICEEVHVARLGGDEFAVILTNVADCEALHAKAASIMEALNKRWVVDGNELYITSSMGVTVYPDDGKDEETLLKNADTAMYTAKDNAKNHYVLYTPDMNEKALRYMSMEKDVRKALSNDEFILHYQPQIDLGSGKIISIEALIRWEHPEKGLVPPMDFIPFAEESGLIVDIGETVMEQACRQLKKWSELGCSEMQMAVNFSARQLHQQDLIEKIAVMIHKMNINSENLVIEITENVALSNLNHSIGILKKLKDMGIKIALDDFGTGYSSLNYLKRLPVDIIKIDKGFVKDICKCADEKYIAKTVIDLAHNMDLTVIAEGIETEEQLNILRDFCCDCGQGYLFSKPLPAEKLEELLFKN
ncbi:MAG: bifunctional diguanylate cyclase/phosphodiesterase [Bacillota bacterium]